MTDKQMIDGIDVSECQHYGKCSTYCYVVDELCSDNPNCYYKRLKRKEQECEALQMSDNEAVEIIAELTAYKDINEDFKTAWEELKTENDELKKVINDAKSSKLDLQSFLVGEAIQNEYEQQLDQLKVENEHLSEKEEEARHYLEEAQKFKNCLAEIKEIAERRNYLDYNECLDDILQKISEVENDNK